MEQRPSTHCERLPVLVAFGQIVRQFRKAQGFSQESFAYYCGLDRSYTGGVERGERNINLAIREIIITALQLKPSEFFAALDSYFANQASHGQVIQFRHFAERAQVRRKLTDQGKQSL